MNKGKEKTSLEKAIDECKYSMGLIITIAFVISILFGIPHYFIERNNCTHGAPTSRQAMQYHNGKVNMNSSEYTTTGLICKKYNTGYGMKIVFIYFVIGFAATSGIYIAKRKKEFDNNDKLNNKK